MNLVKWFRKNNAKVMAVVVIVIMVGFVLGSYISYLTRTGPQPRDTVASFLDGVKIKRSDLNAASGQLDILSMLNVYALLQGQDMQGLILGELLFAERSTRGGSPAVLNFIRQTAAQNNLSIGSKDIAELYDRSLPSTVFWLLLKEEAHRAGIRVANAEVGQLLTRMIPQLFNNQQNYQTLIGAMQAKGYAEKQILEAFGDMLAILQYAHVICSGENVTINQAKQLAALQGETLDVDFVRFDAEVFAKTAAEPNEEEVVEHFNKYKNIKPYTVTNENPYGFGYKLPDRLRLEYIAVKLDDIAKIVKKPTHEEMESYYKKNTALFVEEVPADPTDPNSLLIEKTKDYAEVVDSISERLVNDKIKLKAESILQQAKTLAEPNLAGVALEPENLTSKDFIEHARNYQSIVEQLSKEHSAKIYTGRTGMLSAADLQIDSYLGRLAVRGYGYYPVNLTQVLFAVDELAASELTRFDAPKPRMYESIGPAMSGNLFDARTPIRSVSGQIIVLVRVVEAAKACEPSSIDDTLEKHSLVFDPNEDKTDEHTFSVRKNVTMDIKKLAALETTSSRAEQFINLAAKTDWDSAITKFNTLYGNEAKDDPNDPNWFALDYLAAVRRTSNLQLNTLAARSQGSPSAEYFLNQARIEGQFTDKLYALVPADSNTPDVLPTIVEFKPNMSFFCIKDLTVKRLWKEDFDQVRPLSFYKQDAAQSQSLATVHFKPANILKRMKFKLAEKNDKDRDANEPAESEDAA
ncbi:MAG: hypothetical protein JW720_00680 [Sedimentisphaerales bacterium]|nr:hypothetical protein [Sedimentisphaerales bacterium]